MKCVYCGAELEGQKCSYCGSIADKPEQNIPVNITINNYAQSKSSSSKQSKQHISTKNKGVAILLACLNLIGVGGIHRFYVGKNKSGVLYLCTFGLFFIGTIIDIVSIKNGTFTDSKNLPLRLGDDFFVKYGNIIRWCIAGVLVMGALGSFGSGGIIAGFLLLLCAFVVSPLIQFIPIFSDKPKKRKIAQVATAATLFVAGTVAIPDTPEAPEVEPISIVTTTEQAAVTTIRPVTTTVAATTTKSATTTIETTTETTTKTTTTPTTTVTTTLVSFTEATEARTYTVILNTSTMCYHSRMCRAAKKIAPENYSEMQVHDYSEAESMGYTACGICN